MTLTSTVKTSSQPSNRNRTKCRHVPKKTALTRCLKVKLGPRKDKSTSARTRTAHITGPVSPVCSKHIAKNPYPHTPVSCSHTCSTCSASGSCLFRCPWLSNHHPTHFTSPLLFLSALPECIGSDFEDFSASCLPEGMWSLWLIRGSPVSDCPQPPLSVPLPRFNTFFYTSASPSQTPCCKSGPPVHQDLRRDARALRRTADT